MNFAKKIMMVALTGTAVCLMACSDDGSTEVVGHGTDGSMDILAHNEDLNKQDCDKGNAGEKLFVADSNAAFVCNGESWELYDATEDVSGECTTKSVKNKKKTKIGVQITCDEVVVDTLWDGDKGADEAEEDGCSFKSVKNKKKTESGMQVQCGDVVLDTIWNNSDAKDSDSKESADSKKDDESKESADSKKDDEGKESADSKKDDESKESANSKKDSDSKESADSKKDDESKESADSKKDDDSKESADSKKDDESKESANSKKDDESKESADSKADDEGKESANSKKDDDSKEGDDELGTAITAYCITITYNPEVSYCKDGYVLSKEGVFRTGTMVDERDLQEYKIVKIGDDVWMAGNLNYETEGSVCGGGSDEDSDGDCDTYGRLYNFEAASQICPDGWRLPTESEALKVTEGRSGSALRTADLWDVGSHVAVGTDEIGFSAIPSGYFKDGEYYGTGSSFVAWTSSKVGGRLRQLHVYGAIAPGTHDTLEEDDFGSVRCVKE